MNDCDFKVRRKIGNPTENISGIDFFFSIELLLQILFINYNFFSK